MKRLKEFGVDDPEISQDSWRNHDVKTSPVDTNRQGVGCLSSDQITRVPVVVFCRFSLCFLVSSFLSP
jgi:hypothetical protein